MSEENQQVNDEKSKFLIQKFYVKDISFETPNSPQIFSQKGEASMHIDVGTNASPLGNDMHEVTLSLTVTVKVGETPAYLVEVQQSGLFIIGGYDDETLSAMLGSFCPNMLFPYAREVVTDLVTKGGFPQLVLAPINFDALYAQEKQKAAGATTQ